MRGHERPAIAGNAGIRTGCIQPGRIHDKRLARNVSTKPLVEQAHAIKVQARIGSRARGNNTPASTYGQAACGNASNWLVKNACPVGPGIDRAAVHHKRLGHMDPALRTRRRERAGADKRKVTPHLHAAHGNVRIGHMRLDHGVLPHKCYHQVAVGADGLARIAGKLQMVGFGPSPPGPETPGS